MPDRQPGDKVVAKLTKSGGNKYVLSCYIQLANGKIESLHDSAGPIEEQDARDIARSCADLNGFQAVDLDWQYW